MVEVGEYFWKFIEKIDKAVFGVNYDFVKYVFVDQSVDKFEGLDNKSDHFSIVFKVEQHVVNLVY